MARYGSLVRLGLPIVVGQIGNVVLGFADTIMVGHHSMQELAAASFVNTMFTLVVLFATGFSYGLTPVVGSLFGRGDTGSIGVAVKKHGPLGGSRGRVRGVLPLHPPLRPAR